MENDGKIPRKGARDAMIRRVEYLNDTAETPKEKAEAKKATFALKQKYDNVKIAAVARAKAKAKKEK